MNDDVNCSDLFGFILHLTALKKYLFIYLATLDLCFSLWDLSSSTRN